VHTTTCVNFAHMCEFCTTCVNSYFPIYYKNSKFKMGLQDFLEGTVLPPVILILLFSFFVGYVFSSNLGPLFRILKYLALTLCSRHVGPRCFINWNLSNKVFVAVLLVSVCFLVSIRTEIYFGMECIVA
jgi:hypothetical protein